MITKKESLSLKGIAILLLIYYHVIIVYGNCKNAAVSYFFYNTGNICVSIFAFISVYGITKKMMNVYKTKKDIVSVYKKRYVALYKNYWIVFGLSVILWKVFKELFILIAGDKSRQFLPNFMDTYGGGAKGVLHLIINFFGLTHLFYGDNIYTLNQTWWYLSVAFFIILFTPAFYILSENKKYHIIGIVICFILALTTKNLYLQYTLFIFMGIECAKRDFFKDAGVLKILIMLILTAVTIAYRVIFTEKNYVCLFDTVGIYALIYLIVLVLRKIPVLNYVLGYLGKHSSNIFYMHSFVYYYWLLTKLWIDGFEHNSSKYFVTLIISLFLSYIIMFIEKLADKIISRLK